MSKEDFIRAKFGDLLQSRDERLANNGVYPLYSLTIKDGVTPKTDRYEREFLVTDKSSKKYKVIRTGDLVYNPSNLRWGAIATSSVPFPVLASPIYEVFHPNDPDILDPYYLGALASSPLLMHRYLSRVEGTLVERTALKKDDFMEIEVTIPPILEQKKIAEIICGIDANIAAVLKEKQHRERLRRSAIKQLTRGVSFSGQTKDSRTEFGMIPSHWDCLLIPECCTIENSKRNPIKKEERAKMRGTYPYHGATRIQDHISQFAYEGDYVLVGEDGDHFSKYDEWEMAQLATGRFNVSNHAHVIKGGSNCSTKWLYYSLLHRDLTYHLTRQGATRFKLSKASLECIPIIFPPPEEQEKLTITLDSITQSITALSNKINKLQVLKQSLISDLLSGRNRVSV